MRRSDIFENFVKIAEDKGLLSGTTHEEAKRKLEENPRMDSLDTAAIEALYGVKPDVPEGMKYEKNIAEIAHPNAVVISPSYDKVNGLVENINERQNIIMNIVDATPDGVLRNRKYAQQELLTSLVRVANDLDNKDHDDLRVLADTCLQQMSRIEKRAFWGMGLGASVATVVVPIALTVGAVYLQQHLPFINEGVQINYNKLIAELDDMINSNSEWGVGHEYTQKFHDQLVSFKERLENFQNTYDSVVPVIDALEEPKDGKELLRLSQEPKTSIVLHAVKKLEQETAIFFPYLEGIERNFSNETYKLRQIKDKGFLTRFVDWTQVLHGGKGWIADDFDDVIRAISPYKKSILETIEMLKTSKSVEDHAKKQLTSALISQKAQSTETFTSTPKKEKDSREESLDLGAELETLRNAGLPL